MLKRKTPKMLLEGSLDTLTPRSCLSVIALCGVFHQRMFQDFKPKLMIKDALQTYQLLM